VSVSRVTSQRDAEPEQQPAPVTPTPLSNDNQ
jgi:hypothetical protein